MNDWKVIWATVVIFGTGVITGGLLVNYVQHSPHKNGGAMHKSATSSGTNSVATTNNPSQTTARLPEILSKPFLPKLDTALALSPDQHKNIEKIITDGQGDMRKVMQDVRQCIREQLTPDQRKKFDEMLKPIHPNSTSHHAPATNAPSMTMPTNAPVMVTNSI